MCLDENDKTSAVSMAYLEDGGAKKINDKVYHDLFVSFIDFRLPDTYGLVKIGNDYHLNAKVEKVGTTDPNENRFRFFACERKRFAPQHAFICKVPFRAALWDAICFCRLFQ